MPDLVLDVLDASGARDAFVELSAAHRECFPSDVPSSGAETVDEFFDRVTWLHDESSTTWFVLRANVRASKVADGVKARRGDVVGFACGVAYANSWYGAHLAVRPKYRGRGYGSYLMRASQAHAAKLGITKLQASVDVCAHVGSGRLLGYYESHGARVTITGFGSAGSVEPSVVRIEREFTADVARRELEESEAVIFRSSGRRLRAMVFGVIGACACAVIARKRLSERRGM